MTVNVSFESAGLSIGESHCLQITAAAPAYRTSALCNEAGWVIFALLHGLDDVETVRFSRINREDLRRTASSIGRASDS